MNTKYKICVLNLGCKLNIFEGQAIIDSLQKEGYIICSDIKSSDIVIVNSCTVTATADNKSRKYMRRAKNYGKKVIATGCYATTDSQDVANLAYVDLVISNSQKFKIHEYISLLERRDVVLESKEDFVSPSVLGFERTRAFLKVQNGCNQSCTFCKIPFARGLSISQDPFILRQSLEDLLKQSYKEIVLTGINIGDYSFDGKNLLHLVKMLFEVEGGCRLRLSSLLPNQFDLGFISLLENTKLAPHFHFSVQSGSNSVLKRMNRWYTREELFKLVTKIRSVRPDTAITLDLIVGFPGETEEEFLETLDLVNVLEASRVHIFPYSARPGTVASEHEDMATVIKKRREKLLHRVSGEVAYKFVKKYCIGQTYSVLTESGDDILKEGYTENYLRLQIHTNIINDFHRVSLKNVGLDSKKNLIMSI